MPPIAQSILSLRRGRVFGAGLYAILRPLEQVLRPMTAWSGGLELKDGQPMDLLYSSIVPPRLTTKGALMRQ